MNTETPPPALGHLFPELPRWALAPFLGAPYTRVPRRRGTSHQHSVTAQALRDDGPHTSWHAYHTGGVGWEAHFTHHRTSNRRIVALWTYEGLAMSAPFGCTLADVMTGTSWDAARQTHWERSPLEVPPSPPITVLDAAQRDLLMRWQRIPEAAARQAILGFWVGHTIPLLAELGLRALHSAPQGAMPR